MREPIPINNIPFNELFHNILVVENEFLLIFVKHFIVFEVVPAELLYGVVFEFEFGGGLVLFFHVF